MRFALKILGCRLNHAEAEAWAAQLSAAGWQVVAPEVADLIILHSCAVTATAEHESARTLRRFHESYPHAKLVLTGCASKLVAEGADLVVSHAEQAHLVQKLLATFAPAPARASAQPVDASALGTATEQLAEAPTPAVTCSRSRPALVIQDGCDVFCSYCIVPHLRGAPVSVPHEQILERARAYCAAGYEEIVLTGCHLARYHSADTTLVELLDALSQLPGKTRFRLGSIECCGLAATPLLRLIAQRAPRICRYLHIPLQSGSETILHAMRRPYTLHDVHALLNEIAERLPGCGLGADWIVGFPGETDADFAATCQLVRDYPFNAAHVFPYSPRPGTPATTFSNQVPAPIAAERARILTALVQEKRDAFARSLIGTPQQILVERNARGWTEQRIACRCSGPRSQLVTVTPTRYEGGILQ